MQSLAIIDKKLTKSAKSVKLISTKIHIENSNNLKFQKISRRIELVQEENTA